MTTLVWTQIVMSALISGFLTWKLTKMFFIRRIKQIIEINKKIQINPNNQKLINKITKINNKYGTTS